MGCHSKVTAVFAAVALCFLAIAQDVAPAAAAAPPVGAEHPVSDVVSGPAEGLQVRPAVASDGSNYLVVWQDERDQRSSDGDDIFATRVNASGTVLDPTGIPIAVAPQQQSAPAVAFDGTNYLVVWQDGPDGGSGDVIRGTRVAPDGTVLDPGGFVIASSAGNDLMTPSIAWNGSRYLVVYELQDNTAHSSDIRATRVSGAGAVLDPNGIPVTTAAGGQDEPDVVAGGSTFYVVWRDFRNSATASDIYGARVGNAGVVTPTSAAITARAGNQNDPSVGWNGSVFFVAWSQQLGDATSADLYGARIGPAGGVQKRNIPLHVTAAGEWGPDVVGVGSAFFISWAEITSSASNRPVLGARYDSNGVPLDSGDTTFATVGGTPSAAVSGPNSLFVAWSSGDAAISGGEVRGARDSTSGSTPAGGTLLSTSAAPQHQADIAFDGTNFLAVWQELRANGYRVVASRVTPGGTRLDGTGVLLGGGTSAQFDPAVAWDGTNYFVVWNESGVIVGTRVTPAGVVLDPSGIVIDPAPNNTAPRLAWNGANFVVVWGRFTTTPPFASEVFARRVSASGVVLDTTDIGLATGPSSATGPAIAAAGSTALAVWSVGGDIVGTRIASNGSVLDPSGITVSAAPNAQQEPAVASNGSAFMVVWSDTRTDGFGDIYGARVSTGGVVADPNGIPISTAPNGQDRPALAFDGAYLAVWRDERNDPFGDIYGARVQNGSVGDPSGFPVSATPLRDDFPAVTNAGNAGAGVAYERFASGSPYGASRVFVRTVAPK